MVVWPEDWRGVHLAGHMVDFLTGGGYSEDNQTSNIDWLACSLYICQWITTTYAIDSVFHENETVQKDAFEKQLVLEELYEYLRPIQ